MATQSKSLADMISLILSVASPYDQVVVKINSPGGFVSAYGFAASQLVRVRKANLRLVVCTDQIAASGGYMMGRISRSITLASLPSSHLFFSLLCLSVLLQLLWPTESLLPRSHCLVQSVIFVFPSFFSSSLVFSPLSLPF
jgi:hypothetical protein